MWEVSNREIFLWLVRRRQRYRVTGNSMLPLLAADDEVLVDPKAYRRHPPGIGDVVVARHPTLTGLKIIKRIMALHENDRYVLNGDNPDPSLNSSSVVSSGQVLGRVTCRFAAAP